MIATDQASAALAAIPADLPRDEWLKASMAAKSAGVGFEDWREWCATAESYDARDCADVWRSINARGSVTAGTLYFMARQYGSILEPPSTHQNTPEPPPRPEPISKPQAPGMAAADVWARCNPATWQHAYIAAKGAAGVPLDDLRVLPAGDPLRIAGQAVAGFLVVPARGSGGELQSLQFISPPGAGRKVNLPRATLKGARFVVGALGDTGPVFVCEGVGTAWACWQATGRAAAVAFGAGNMAAIAAQFGSRAVLVPDAGQEEHAEKAARELGCRYVTMPAGSPNNFDACDLAQRDGADALAALLDGARAPAPVDVPADHVVLTRAADLRLEPIAWLWPDWLARGKLHLVAGAPGQGKTTIALALAAAVTTAGRWPDGTRCPRRGRVLMYSREDDPADTLAPRLLAAGADLERVQFITGTRTGGEAMPFDPARDLDLLRAAIAQIDGGIDLLVVDPVVGVVTGDSHKNTETRRALQPLVDLAAASGCALVGITHFSKGGQGTDPAMRVIGSVAFTALARVVMVAARVKAEEGKPGRILARAKSNIGPDDGGIAYDLAQSEVAAGITASFIRWGEVVKGTARELLTDPDAGDEDAGDAADAAELLRAELVADYWTPAAGAMKSMKTAGFSPKQVRTASKKLHVVRKKGGYTGGWYWHLPGGDDPELPQDAPQGAQGAQYLNGASWASSEEKGTLGTRPTDTANTAAPPPADAHAREAL